MGYIKSRVNGTVQGMYCDICGKEYVRVVSNPNNSSQDMCVKCYNDFYNGGQQKDQQIAELKAENAQLQQQLKDNTKQVRKEVLSELMNMLGDRAELIDFGNGCAEFMFTTYDLQECSKEILDQIQDQQGKVEDVKD